MKIVLGILTIGGLATLLLATFLLPDFINAENKDYLLEARDSIKLTSLIILGVLFVFYLIFSLISNKIPKDKKYLWAALIFFGHIFVMPFFWYQYIWKNNAT